MHLLLSTTLDVMELEERNNKEITWNSFKLSKNGKTWKSISEIKDILLVTNFSPTRSRKGWEGKKINQDDSPLTQ